MTDETLPNEDGQWDDDYEDRNEWCEECDDLFRKDSLEDGLCPRCQYVHGDSQ